MKCSIPEISWHNREPVLSADLQPINTTNNDFYRLATGGSDTLVLIWKLKVLSDGQVQVTVLSELTRHQRSVNVVKWSPNGEILASADDDANIILWQLRTDNVPSLDERENEFEEKWNAFKVLRGHKEDVYDLCWSPKSDRLLSGSVDNTAILWDVLKGNCEYIIRDHKGFIQGVAWDPKSDFIATLCSDRICRVFDRNGRRVCARIGRGKLPVEEGSEFYDKDVKYFHDDTFKTYFRRLDFTPDGSLLLVPSGAVETEEKKNALFGTFVFTLDALSNPVGILPSGKQCSIVVKCCPMLFELRDNGPKPLLNLPYRMIIAVATDSDVILYDTQQESPCVHLQNIHYTRLTDLTWSVDGLLLAASSTDGFITLITFDDGELGVPYVKEDSDVEDSVLNISGCDLLPQEEVKVVDEVEQLTEKPKKPSFLQQWATKRKTDGVPEEQETKKVKSDLVVDLSNGSSMDSGSNEVVAEINAEVAIVEQKDSEVKRKRITPILISNDVQKKAPSPDKSSSQIPIEGQDILKAKKRIQPTKIGEVNMMKKNNLKPGKSVEKVPEKLEKSEEKPMEVYEIVDSTEDVPEEENTKENVLNLKETIQNTQKVVETLNNDDMKMPAPSTPTNKDDMTDKLKNTPKTESISTPNSNKTKTLVPKLQTTPHNDKTTTEKTSSSKKKKIPAQPNNTLFNYLKPITKTPTADLKPTENGEKIEGKSDFKPQKLFGKEDTIDKPLNSLKLSADLKIKVSNLVKFKTKPDASVSTDSEETIPDIPEDFVLRVDDVVNVENDLSKKTPEKQKENGAEIKNVSSVKKIELDVPMRAEGKRRIPLITLSSPKNKKKPMTAE